LSSIQLFTSFGFGTTGYIIIDTASALGLIEPEQIAIDSNTSYGTLIQTCSRFILEQIYQESCISNADMEYGTMTKDLFSYKMQSISVCLEKEHVQQRDVSPFVIDLIYTRNVYSGLIQSIDSTTFADVLTQSINRVTVTRAWCTDCNKYQMTKQMKKLVKMPNFMFINANVSSESDLNIWIGDGNVKLPWLPSKYIKISSRFALVLHDGNITVKNLDREKLEFDKYGCESEIAYYDLRVQFTTYFRLLSQILK
jgi:hypothetical protein